MISPLKLLAFSGQLLDRLMLTAYRLKLTDDCLNIEKPTGGAGTNQLSAGRLF